MDILRKLFNVPEKSTNRGGDALGDDDNPTNGRDAFRKPQWFEESETDDELFDDARSKFAFQIFTNPMELQRHFERQMSQIFEAMNESEEGADMALDQDVKEKFLLPGYEEGAGGIGGGSKLLKELEEHKKSFIDTDLDGEIYADQLHSLMQRLTTPGGREFATSKDGLAMGTLTPSILPPNDKSPLNRFASTFFGKRKLSDEELILARIHGTLPLDSDGTASPQKPPPPPRPPRQRPDSVRPMVVPRAATPFGGVFEGTYQGPKMFSQSVMSKTIRKPDGSYETTKVTQDSAGHKTTTVTRTMNGKTETITTQADEGQQMALPKLGAGQFEADVGAALNKNNGSAGAANVCVPYGERNLFVSKERYVMPRNLW